MINLDVKEITKHLGTQALCRMYDYAWMTWDNHRTDPHADFLNALAHELYRRNISKTRSGYVETV